MKTSTVQKVLLDVADPEPRVSATVSPPAVAAGGVAADGDDGLPPPTKAQVFYWAQLCGELHRRGTDGIAGAEGWPSDLMPSHATLEALQERSLVARRGRAWKLRRRWYERLSALKARAVHTPPLRLTERPAPNLPTYAELEAWEAVCRWLDTQPGRKARLPFVGLEPLLAAQAQSMTREVAKDIAPDEEATRTGPFVAEHLLMGVLLQAQRAHEAAEHAVGEQAQLLKGMRRYRLVRHTSGCAWALSPRWREKLRDLHAGIERSLRESAPSSPPAAPARSLCAGLDTWALNWVVEQAALPARLRRELDDAQELARAREGEVETAWVYDGMPLRMYQAGVRAKGGKGSKGVSWSYILVNPSLRLLIRRTALGGIVANARLGSECLWRRTPRAALDELHVLIRRLWGREQGHWQVSYAHLAHDVANAPLEREQLDRYVSRSRRQAIYDAAKGEMARLLREARPRAAAGAALDHLEWGLEGDDSLPIDALPLEDALYDWEAEFGVDGGDEELLTADAFAAEEGDAWSHWGRTPRAVQQAKAELETNAEQRAITAHRWGKRLSGVAFSPGGTLSFVMYRKDWEGRLKGKRHMEPLWKAAGWDGKEPVTRHEARLVREPIRELSAAGSDRAILDDPWQFLEELSGIWARMVGWADTCPEAVDVAWLRRVAPREGESNRSRWDTDPVWRVVQAAPFTPAPLACRRLMRRTQQQYDMRTVDRGLLGLLKRREALLRADPTGRDLSLALRDAMAGLERELAAKGEPFDEAVRRKRQDCGLPVPLAGRVLPLRPRWTAEETDAPRTLAREFERDLDLMGHEAALGIEQEAGGLRIGRGEANPDLAGALQSDAGSDLQANATGSRDRVGTYASLRARSAELRMREAYAALEMAEAAGRPGRELDRLAAVFERALGAHDAARRRVAAFDRAGGVGH
jgi:hypothetical protein